LTHDVIRQAVVDSLLDLDDEFDCIIDRVKMLTGDDRSRRRKIVRLTSKEQKLADTCEGLIDSLECIKESGEPPKRLVNRLLAREGTQVRAGSRGLARARAVCDAVAGKVADARIEPCATGSAEDLATALDGAELLIAAGAAGIEMLSADARAKHRTVKVAIDLNAVPPVGMM